MQAVRKRPHLDLHRVRLPCGIDEPLCGLDRLGYIDNRSGTALSSRQTQEVLGDAATAQQLLARNRSILVDPGLIHLPLLLGRSLAKDAFDAGKHGAQRSVQLVRKAGG